MTSHWVFVVSNTARAARFPTQTHKQSIDYVHLCASSAFACVFSTSTILSHNVRSAHWLRCDCTRCLTHFSGRRQYNNRNVVCCLQWAAVWSFFERSIHRSVAFLFCGLDSMPLPPSLLLAAYCSSFFWKTYNEHSSTLKQIFCVDTRCQHQHTHSQRSTEPINSIRCRWQCVCVDDIPLFALSLSRFGRVCVYECDCVRISCSQSLTIYFFLFFATVYDDVVLNLLAARQIIFSKYRCDQFIYCSITDKR